jgi:hypothetical protein
LALVKLLPETVQQQVRKGAVASHIAMTYLVPVARANLNHCHRMADAFSKHRFSSCQAGELYAARAECIFLHTPTDSGFSGDVPQFCSCCSRKASPIKNSGPFRSRRRLSTSDTLRITIAFIKGCGQSGVHFGATNPALVQLEPAFVKL